MSHGRACGIKAELAVRLLCDDFWAALGRMGRIMEGEWAAPFEMLAGYVSAHLAVTKLGPIPASAIVVLLFPNRHSPLLSISTGGWSSDWHFASSACRSALSWELVPTWCRLVLQSHFLCLSALVSPCNLGRQSVTAKIDCLFPNSSCAFTTTQFDLRHLPTINLD